MRRRDQALKIGAAGKLRITRPFAPLHKNDVMQIGREFPLELTFSCIAPVAGLHCGACNKCAERREAFRRARLIDRTHYAAAR